MLNETEQDIWQFKDDEKKVFWLCITTNGILNSRGQAIMGKGLSAKQKIPGKR